MNNTQGVISADQGIEVNSQGLNNQKGQIGTQGHLTLQVGNLTLNNQAGLLQAGQDLIIDAASIDNSLSGKISAQGQATLQTTGLLNNQTGAITANQDITLTSHGLNNIQGQIGSVAGSLNLEMGDQVLNNQSGSLLSGQHINIHASGLNNNQGQIIARQILDIDTELQELNNKQGLISADTANIRSGTLNNDQGLIQTNNVLSIDTQSHDLINTHSGSQGGLLSQGNLTLKNLATIDNTQGYIASGQTLDITANQVQNGSGTLLAAQNLKLQGSGQNQLLSNQSGQLLSMGDMSLNIDRINNAGKVNTTDTDSHIMAAGQLNINTQQLDNQNTALTNSGTSVQGIDAGSLNLNALAVDNQSGVIRSSKNSQLDISQQLNNQFGEISAVEQLGIQGNSLAINNQKGKLLAGENLNIAALSLNGDGQILSLGNADIKLQESFKQTQAGQLQANNNLSLTTAGDIQNDGKINAGNILKLSATNVNNSRDAQIESHDTQITAQDQINNTGLINGDYTTLKANIVNNQGSGRIYGTELAIGANTLNNLPDVNGQAPVIASRGDMNLGVQALNNLANTTDYTSQALILSAGNMYLGGALDTNRKATGQASVINNESATIESLGDMYLFAKQINNINRHFITSDNVEVSRVDGLKKFCNAWCTFDGKYYDGNWYEDWMTYTYSEITYETRTVESAPGQIKAGGNLDLGSAHVLNDNSQILAGGELKNQGGVIEPGKGIDGIKKIVDKGIQTKHWEYEGQWDNPFEVSTESTINLQISQALGNQKINQSSISVTNVSNNKNDTQIQSSQVNPSHLNDLKDSDVSTQVGQAQNAQGQNISVVDTVNTSNNTSIQTGQQTQPTNRTKDIDAKITGSQSNVAQAVQANGQNLDAGHSVNISNNTQTQSVQQNQPTNQAKDIDAKITGSQSNVAQADQANGQNLDTGHSANISNNTQTQSVQQNQPTNQSKDLDAKISSSQTNVAQAGQAGTQNLSMGSSANVSNSTQTQQGQQNQALQQSKDLNATITESQLNVAQADQVSGQNQVIKDGEQVTNSSEINASQQNYPAQQSKDLSVAVDKYTQQKGHTADQTNTQEMVDQVNAPDQAADAVQYEIRTLTASEVKVPNSALYRVNKDSKAGYLIETDPSFTNYKNWLSSDYMLDALGLDPALQQKRLADGFYEQRMVQDQIANLTGYRFLAGYTTDDEQYKALMNNGVTFAKQYGLRPGIALSADQVAQLTSDIVWLVEKDVILKDGTKAKALVPQVYVKARMGDLKGDGTLLSGNSIKFNLDGDLINGATIAGRQAVEITADNVHNLNGRIQGNQVAIEAKKDLNNIGGQIIAKDAMALKVGGNLKVETTTRTSTSQVGGFGSSITGVDRIAGLYVGNGSTVQPNQATLVVDVVGNTVLKAAELNNSNGATVINTVGNVDIGTVQTGYKLTTYQDARNNATSQKTQDIGSQINSTDSLLISGQNIKVKGSALNSVQGTTQLSAVDELNIEEGRKTSQFDSQSYNKHKGVLSSKSTSNLVHNQSDEAIASTVEGNKVILDAKNINIQGSQVVSKELTQIQAKENIKITTAENQYSNQQEQTVKKSGFNASLSDGAASVGYAKSNLNTKEDGKSTTLAQSVIRSQTGDTTIIAGKDLTAEAAILDAGKNLNLKGANVNLNAAYTTDEKYSEVHSKQSGISVGVTYSPALAAKSAYDKSMGDNQYSDSAIGKIMSQANAIDKGLMAAQTPIVVSGGSKKTEQTKNTFSSQAVVTQVAAKGNLNIIATEGSINSQGAQLSAEGDALLHAKENINLAYAQDHSTQTADRKQKGFSIDSRDWIAPGGVFNNQEQGQANTSKTTGTQLSVGGKTTLQTEQGDINILGSSIASQGDVNLNAARDINIKSTQNSQSQSEHSSNKGIGSAQISDTEKFFGYMNGNSQSSSNGIEQQRSQVGSLTGNVNIQAGNQYTQQVADIVAKKDLNISAQQINVLEDHTRGSSSSAADDLKIGIFAKVSSPILDLINSIDKTAHSKADDRTQALQAVAAGAQGYQTYSDIKGGALFKAEAGIGFSTSENQQNSSYATSQQNNLKAGGNVNLTSTNGDIHLQNTQVKAEDKINLDSAKNIVLESGQSQNKADGKNSNAGLSIGYGVSVGAQTGVYIYGEAGYGKGSNHLDNTTQNNTTLNAEQINLKSQGDTTLRGAQANANRIDTNVGGQLKVESLQDTVEQSSNQMGVGGRVQASFGTAWQASGNFSSSQASGNSNSVNQQSGLFAGDGGYHVKADSVDLKGGAIVSTASKDNNDLTANRLTFSNIENQSQYDATTVSLSGGTSLGKGKSSGDSKTSTPTNNDNWRNATSFSPSLPQHESDKDSSTTYATLSAGNITIGGKSTTVEQLGIHSDASTANRVVETLPNLQTILDKQKTVADATSTIAAASRTYAQDQIKNAAAEKEAIGKQIASQLSPEEQAKVQKMSATEKDAYLAQYGAYDAALANEKAVTKQWGMGGDQSRALNAVTTVITGVLGGQTDIQVAANTLAPYAAQQIGEKFGHGEDKNKAAQLASHAILGATLAYLNGGNPAAGGGAAVASEAAADYLANQYKDNPAYKNEKGEFEPNLLPENVKLSIRDLTAAIGAVVGGTVGDSASNAQLAGVIGQNAVENNYLAKKDVQNLIKDLESTKSETEKAEIYKKYAELSEEKRELAAKACVDISSSACQQAIIDMKDGYNFSQNQNAVLDYKYTLEPEIEWTSGQGPLKLEITKAPEDVYKNTQEVRFVEYENLSDLAKYSNSESSEKIEDYLGSKDYKYTNQPVLDKPLGNMYIFPSLQIAGGALTVAGGALLGATTCETGIGCIVAGYGVASGFDDVRTGGLNFGKEPESHNSTLREDALKSLGMSDQAAAWTSLAVDLTSAGGLAKLGANSSGVLDVAEAAQKAKVDLPPIDSSQFPLIGSANSVDSAAKSAAQEIITADKNLKQAAAVAVAGNPILGIQTKEFTNATLKGMPSYKNLKNEGVIEAIDDSTYKITNVEQYMYYLQREYAQSGNEMHPIVMNQIENFINERKTFLIPAGLPGAHAEIQAQNALYNMSNVVRPENATISTYKLGKSNKIDSQGGPFTACTHCSGIIPQETNIPTGRK
ncbi:hypothetical protein C7G91_06255 [Acinetobacter nosocomialis]|nr:hypothetical protein C7G97_12840 [Acinetobacter nosocomialis]PSE84995.1 hypothetical protein C7G91_06255 [Acinetobacter nosocomialis]